MGLEDDDDPASVWETGERIQRLFALRALRETDPERGRRLVVETFASEPADVRADFVAEFWGNLSIADEPFLEAALDDRSKEVRRRAAGLLGRLPESRLCRRMVERAGKILSWKAGMLGLGRGSLIVEPPSSCDKSMIRDGIRAQATAGSGVGERGTLLHDVISAAPPSAMAVMLGNPAARIVEASRGGEWAQLLRVAWTAATVRHRDAEWADALLEAYPLIVSGGSPADAARSLFEILTPHRQNERLLECIRSVPVSPLKRDHPASALLPAMRTPLEPEVGRMLLREVRRLVEDERAEFATAKRRDSLTDGEGEMYDSDYHDQSAYEHIRQLGYRLPLELVDEATSQLDPQGERSLLYSSAQAWMIDRLTFRRDMHREFST
jgi:hypothetical protein